MDSELHDQLVKDIDELKVLLGRFRTSELLYHWCHYYFVRDPMVHEPEPLMSAYRQMIYCLDLMSTTPEPDQQKTLEQHHWDKMIKSLNTIFSTYALMYFAPPKGGKEERREWERDTQVAMPAFLHYFNTGMMASVEQISERITTNLSPFDDVLKEEWGIGAQRALEMTQFIGTTFQSQINAMVAANKAWQDAERRKAPGPYNNDSDLGLLEAGFIETTRSFMKIKLETLRQRFGSEDADAYWESFTTERERGSDVYYPTDASHVAERPLILISETTAYCPVINALYSALLLSGEKHLLSSSKKDAFLKRRDKSLEAEAEEQFRILFGEAAEYYATVWETPDLHHEHDLVIISNRVMFVIEAKASPPIEPLRDTRRAAERLRQHFKGDRGIQKAFDQANRLHKAWRDGHTVNLYDKKRRRVCSLEASDLDEVFCICITRDNYGPLATTLFLLDKDEEEAYPWAVNILDLANMFKGWTYFGLGPADLAHYLRQREQLYDAIFTDDELNIAAVYLQERSLDSLIEQTKVHTTRISLDPTLAHVFDNVYKANRSAGPPVVLEPSKLNFTSFDDIMSKAGITRNARAQGRNEKCACRSGLKYKHCCGRNVR